MVDIQSRILKEIEEFKKAVFNANSIKCSRRTASKR